MKQHTTTKITKRCIPGVTLHPRDGFYQVRHIGLDAQRVKTDPAFSNTRQQAKEMAQVAKAGKLIGDVLLPGAHIKKMLPRLMPLLYKALRADTTGTPGNRHWERGDWTCLQGFECNKDTSWPAVMGIVPHIHYGRAQQQAIISFPAFIPAKDIHPPEGIEWGRIFSISAVLDMTAHTCTVQKTRTTLIPLKPVTIQPKPLITHWNSERGNVHILAIGIEWYTRTNANGPLIRSSHPAILRLAHISVTSN